MADRKVYDLDAQREKINRLIRVVDSGGGPPHDGGMEDRVKKLEEMAEKSGAELRAIDTRLTKIETRMDTFATKTDISDTKTAIAEAKNSIIKWVVGAIFLAQLLPMLKDFVKPPAASLPAPAAASVAPPAPTTPVK